MLKVKVKASSVTNLTDARYFAAREVAWLGFPLDGDGPGPMAVKAIIEWVDGVVPVGEFGLATASEIRHLCQLVGVETVQVGHFTPLADVRQLAGLTVIKEVIVEASTTENELAEHLADYAPHVQFFLLDFSKTGISWGSLQGGSPFPVSFLENCCAKYPVILALQCAPGEVASVLETLRPAGLGISGGEEEQVGLKSFDELDELLDELEILD